jgi:hypothetical protein
MSDTAPANERLDAATCSALGLAVTAWESKRPRPDLRLEMAAIIHADSVAELADNLEYIAARLRENGWTAGSGGGKHSKLVWEMFCKPNAKRTGSRVLAEKLSTEESK